MASGSPIPDFTKLLKETTESIAPFLQWIAELIRRRNWFMLLVLMGVGLAFLGNFFKEKINDFFPDESIQGQFWTSFWTIVILIFLGALVVAVVTMPRSQPVTEADVAERQAIKGLRPFGREDAEVFSQLQREASLRECCEAITRRNYKFGILMGESGCGKTSFLQAGLWPKLTEEKSSHYGVYVRFSDQEPMETVRRALAEQLEIPLEWLTPLSPPLVRREAVKTTSQESLGSFSKLLKDAVEGAGKPIILLLDQFEQFFARNPRKEDRKPFIEALTRWYADQDLNQVKILVSIRADLLHELYELQSALEYILGPQDLFKLERFTPTEAVKVLAVIAKTEDLDFDKRFVTELTEQELAHREKGTISPVDLQILAWMIERQKGDDLRAFNRNAFQKFGGVEGLLFRFLQRTLDARVLPNQRQASIKVLLALTDLDRQVRAGVLTVQELQGKLKETVKPEEVEEAVTWLLRGDVRLITPQKKTFHSPSLVSHPSAFGISPSKGEKKEKSSPPPYQEAAKGGSSPPPYQGGVRGGLGYELAHERLIPPLMRVAGRELTAADRANQLLERRVNEWLGNQKNRRYLFGWRELRLIQQQKPYLIWGAKREQKEKLIRLSQIRTYGIITLVGFVALAVGIFYGWLNFTTPGQIWQVRRGLLSRMERISSVEVANALIKDGNYGKGMELIRDHIDSRASKARAIQEAAETAVRLQDRTLLQMALETTASIKKYPRSKSRALSAIARATGELEEGTEAVKVLNAALTIAQSIDDPAYKSSALSAIASVTGELEEGTEAVKVLTQALTVAQSIDDPRYKSLVLGVIANAYGALEDESSAVKLLTDALTVAQSIDNPYSKSEVLDVIASAYGELEDESSVVKVLNAALTVAQSIDNPRYKFLALSTIASAYGELEDESSVVKVLTDALTVAQSIDDPRDKFLALSTIASAYGELEDESSVVKMLTDALTVAQSIDDPYSKFLVLGGIASATGELEDASSVVKVLTDALTVAQSIDDSGYKSQALSAIARATGEFEEETEAVKLLTDALTVAQSIDDSGYKSQALSAIARATGELEEETEALKLLTEALTVAQSIDDSGSKSQALSAIARATGELEEGTEAVKLLNAALTVAQSIDDSSSKSQALSAIARAYEELEEGTEAVKLLNAALTVAQSIDASGYKSQALSAIARATGELENEKLTQDFLIEIREVAKQVGASSPLVQIASLQAFYGDWHAALKTLQDCTESDKMTAWANILTYHAERERPQLIDGPVILGVEVEEETMGQYKLSVTIQSPDRDCKRHADWWEVLSKEGELLGRHIIETPQEFKFEQPFTTEETFNFKPNQTILIRAHFNADIDEDPYNGIEANYPTQAMKGTVNKPNSFQTIRLPATFANDVEEEGKQPQECQEN